MPKDSEKLDEILDIVKGVQNQLNFMQVQLGSGGTRTGSTLPIDKGDVGRSSASSVADSKQFQSLEKRFDELADQMNRYSDNIQVISEQLSKLSSNKVEQADERMTQVTRLLEKGLELTEMGSQLTEIKDRLEELLVELATVAKSSEALKGLQEEN